MTSVMGGFKMVDIITCMKTFKKLDSHFTQKYVPMNADLKRLKINITPMKATIE